MTDYRARDILRQYDHPDNRTSPPVVTWRCPKGHLLLRVFITHGGWLVTRQDFKVTLTEWLARTGAPFTADDVRAGRVVRPDCRITTDDHTLPMDIDTWPRVQFEVGCRCGWHSHDIALLAQHCRQARDTRTPFVGAVG